MEMSIRMKMVLGMLMIVGMVVASDATIQCNQVSVEVAPCILYLRGSSDAPTVACCNGIKKLKGEASTPEDRKAVCVCLKSAAGSISGINAQRVAGLASKCQVDIPYKISPSTDCNKVG